MAARSGEPPPARLPRLRERRRRLMLGNGESTNVEHKIGESYLARKELFAKGLKTGRLTVREIERALPEGSLTAAERWLLYYSLRAAEVEIVDEAAEASAGEPLSPAEP